MQIYEYMLPWMLVGSAVAPSEIGLWRRAIVYNCVGVRELLCQLELLCFLTDSVCVQ